jgi:hypothetical protein
MIFILFEPLKGSIENKIHPKVLNIQKTQNTRL